MNRTLATLCMSLLLAGCNGSDGNGSAGNGSDGNGSDSTSTIQIYTSTQAVQCEDTGLSLNETAERLTSAGIDVLSSSCGHLTGLDVPTECGLPTTEINVHEIREENQTDAEELGFSPVTELSDDEGAGYQLVDCAEQQ